LRRTMLTKRLAGPAFRYAKPFFHVIDATSTTGGAQ